MRDTAQVIKRWAFPLGVGVVALLFAVGVVSALAASARASGSTNLKQQAAAMQAQWMAANSDHPKAKVHLAPGQWASCAMSLNQSPIVVTNVQAPGSQYNSYINVIATNKRPYSILGEMNKIVVIKRQVDMCNPNDPAIPPHDYALSGQPGQITVTAVKGDVVTFTTASGSTGQFDYVTGKYL